MGKADSGETSLTADATARRLYLARCVVGALTGVLLLLALGACVMGDVSRTFSDLDQCAVFLLAAVSCALAARAATGRLCVAWHRVLLVLLNLIGNALNAMKGNLGRPRELSLLSEVSDGQDVSITVADSGVGIPPENLTEIFVHGFTTYANGHGFGLHSSALAAREMGGALTVHESVRAHGAAFTLRVPVQRELVPV
ncbi:MAG TPA: ATP-binding protein [Dermatophilaceae bacterium]